jgi:hypothetical protein
LEKVHIEGYKLGTQFCIHIHEKGGVAIYVHKSIGFQNIDIVKHCVEQNIEVCALKLSLGSLNICVLTLYTAPSGNVSILFLKLDAVFQLLYMPTPHLIICGD